MAHRRNGYSRLELVIAFGIAAILVGLLFPAVQKLRAASDRARCANNLRSLGSGVFSYHTAKNHLPPGGSHTSPATSAALTAEAREREWSWAYHILPHIGQADIHCNPDPMAVLAANVQAFSCSARRREVLSNNRTMLDYAANAGTEANGTDGAIQRSTEKPFAFDAFSDGTASTLLLGEKRLNVAEFGAAPGDTHGFAVSGWSEACEAHRFGLVAPGLDWDLPGERGSHSEFGSSHPGVFLAVFADGTVRTIRYSVNPAVWRRACVRNDNERFNFNELQ
jgi:type II secretory pathway pseudopilin PulG